MDNPHANTHGFDTKELEWLANSKAANEQWPSADTPWPELPSTSGIEPEPYPLDALPGGIKAAVGEIRAVTKAPLPLVANSALAPLSLAGQALVDVMRAEHLHGPTGLFLLTIADSGERKSTCDGYFMHPIRDYEDKQAANARQGIEKHAAAMGTWEANYKGVKAKISQLAKAGSDFSEWKNKLYDLEKNKPKPPRVPRLIYTDITTESLRWNLAEVWPSGGLVSSEGGLVLGSHSMGKDPMLRCLTTLNELWHGSSIATDRHTSESFVVHGARLTIALQVQETTLLDFFDRARGLVRGTGFLSRFLIAWPESTQGTRLFAEPPEFMPALNSYNRRIGDLLDNVSIADDGSLSLITLSLTPDAKKAWVTFSNETELELGSSGKFHDVRDVANKAAENAARLAALFHIFENGAGGEIGLEAVKGASRIAAWHLHEARRFFSERALPEELANKAHLERWLVDYCRRENIATVPRRVVQQKASPRTLRKGAVLDAALDELVAEGRVRLLQDGQRKEIHVHPALWKGASPAPRIVEITAPALATAPPGAEQPPGVANVAGVAVAKPLDLTVTKLPDRTPEALEYHHASKGE